MATPEEICAALADCNCIGDMTFKQYVAGLLCGIYNNGIGNSSNFVNLMGVNAAITTSAETVWAPSSAYAQLTSAAAMEIVSSSTDDDGSPVGIGARTVAIDLIDGNYEASTVTVTMNGTTPVAITGTYIAVNDVRIVTAGSSLTNVGTIDVRVVAGPVVKYRMSLDATAAPGENSKSQFIYTIPAGYTGILNSVRWGATGATGGITVSVRTYDSAGIFQTIGVDRRGLDNTAINAAQGLIDFGRGYLLPEKTLIEGRALATAGAGVLSMMGQLLLIPTPA